MRSERFSLGKTVPGVDLSPERERNRGLRRFVRHWRADPVALLSIALGGAAFALYSIGFVYGRVAIIILLYFLTPVWSTLIGRYIMGRRTPRLRILAIIVGLAGLAAMLANEHLAPIEMVGGAMVLCAGVLEVWPTSRTTPERVG